MNKKTIILIAFLLSFFVLGGVFFYGYKYANLKNNDLNNIFRVDKSVSDSREKEHDFEERATLYQEKDQYSLDDFQNTGNLEEAEKKRLVEKLNKVYVLLREHEKKYPYWIEIGLIKKTLGDYTGAISAWRNAVSLSKRPVLAYGNLADLYFHYLRNYEKAEEYYQKALELNPRNFTYREGLADLYRYDLKEKSHLVEEIMLEGAKQDPANKIFYYAYLVEFFTENKNAKKAQEYKDKIYKIDPKWKPYTEEETVQ